MQTKPQFKPKFILKAIFFFYIMIILNTKKYLYRTRTSTPETEYLSLKFIGFAVSLAT